MSKTQDLIVLQIHGDELRVARARVQNQQAHLSGAATLASRQKTDDAVIFDDQLLVDALTAHVRQQGWAGLDAICVLSGSNVACQYLDLPNLSPKALQQAATLKMGQQMHFPVAEARVDIRVLRNQSKPDGSQVQVSATAARRALADRATAVVEQVGLNLVAICAAPDALMAAARSHPSDLGERQALLDVDERFSTLVAVDGEAPCVAAELPVALADLTAALMRPIIKGEEVLQLDEAQAVKLRDEVGIPGAQQAIEAYGITGERLLPLLEPLIQKTTKQITQWMSFAGTCGEGGAFTRLGLVGAGASLPGLVETLSVRLSMEVSQADWTRKFVTGDSPDAKVLQIMAPAAAAALHWKSLPNLLPAEVRSERKIRRVSRHVALAATAAAAVLLAFAFVTETLNRETAGSMRMGEEQLGAIQQRIDAHRQWKQTARNIKRIEADFSEFVGTSPQWVGVFKELSVLLPAQIQVVEYSTQSQDDHYTLTVRGTVYRGARGGNFDEVVTQTLLLLQRSAFFRRVELVTANRAEGFGSGPVAGTLVVQLELADFAPKKRKAS